MIYRRTALACGLLLLLPRAGPASDFTSGANGTTAADFLSLGVGARAMGMGGAYSAVADDATALYWNPAALTRIRSRSATFMDAPYIADSFFDYAAYGQKLGSGAFGLGLEYFSAGSITQTQNSQDLGTFNPYDLAASLGYAYDLGGYSIGAAGKYIQSKILASARTEAADIGLLSPGYLGDRLRLALTAANLGGSLRYDQARENLPQVVKLGGAFRITERWLGAVDAASPRGGNPYLSVGTEYKLVDGELWRFSGRAGYTSETLNSINGFTGASFGIGLGFKGMLVDLSFSPYGGLGQAERVSLTFNWGAPGPARRGGRAARPRLDEKKPAAPSAAYIQDLKTGDGRARANAAVELGRLRSEQAVGPLISALSDESISVRGAAADALGKIGDHQALEPLAALLQDPNAKVRALAARALGALGDPKASPLLDDAAANDADPLVRKMAAEAINRLSRSMPF